MVETEQSAGAVVHSVHSCALIVQKWQWTIIYIGQGVIAYAVSQSSWAGRAGVGADAPTWTCHGDQRSLILLLPCICCCPGECFLLLKQKLFMHSTVPRAVQTLKCGYDSFLLMEANPWHKRRKLFCFFPSWHGRLYNRLEGFLVWLCSLLERTFTLLPLLQPCRRSWAGCTPSSGLRHVPVSWQWSLPLGKFFLSANLRDTIFFPFLH